MTSDVSFERELRTFLDEKAGHAAPSYVAEVLVRTAVTSQRKRWSSLGWWLPLHSVRGFLPTPAPATLRFVLVALLVLALLGAFVAGALLRRSAPPFGPASNGVIAIANPTAILIADADGSNQRVLVEAEDGVESLSWSPDGTKLAFRSLSPTTGQPAVMVVNQDGTNLADVTPGVPVGGYDEAVAWSPDSLLLAIPSPGDGPRLIVANADGSGALALDLEIGARSVDAAAWSPDGQWIAVAASGQSARGLALYLVRPDGSGARFVAALAEDSHGGPPQWAADPAISRLLFVDVDGGISSYDLPTDRLHRLSVSGNWPSWSPDATKIAWWDRGILVGDVVDLRAGGSPTRLVTVVRRCPARSREASSMPCGPPIWSPDGTRILAPDVSGKAIVALSADGSQPPITIALPPGTELNPTGSATWQRIARSWWP
jgi:WD40 repeat protein